MARGLCNVFVKMTGIGAEIGNPQAHVDQGRVLEPSGADCDEPCRVCCHGVFCCGWGDGTGEYAARVCDVYRL